MRKAGTSALLYSALMFFCVAIAFAQDNISIKGTFKNSIPNTQVNLVGYFPKQHSMAQGTIVGETLQLTLPATTPTGVYRIYFGQAQENRSLDIIINGEKEIVFTLDASTNATGVPVFSASAENKLWYTYIAGTISALAKIEQLRQFAMLYPDKKDKIYLDVRKTLIQEEKSLALGYSKFVASNATTLAGIMVKNRPNYFSDVDASLPVQQEAMYKNFWNGVDGNNQRLLNTPLYSDLIFDYINFYMRLSQNADAAKMEKGFMEAVDVIMKQFDQNTETRQFAMDFLTAGFKQMGQESVLQYLDESYRVAQCTNGTDPEFDKRMAGYNALRTGMTAPDITLGQMKLSAIAAEKTVVAFWAGWCPHCKEDMPKLNAAIAGRKDVTVVAISLDDDPTSYREASSMLGNMMHFCDLKKWNGEAAEKFYIMGTPTYFLLDKDKKIIGKYSTAATLLKDLKE